MEKVGGNLASLLLVYELNHGSCRLYCNKKIVPIAHIARILHCSKLLASCLPGPSSLTAIHLDSHTNIVERDWIKSEVTCCYCSGQFVYHGREVVTVSWKDL